MESEIERLREENRKLLLVLQSAVRRYSELFAAYHEACVDVAKTEQSPAAVVNDRYSRDGYSDEISALLPVGTKLYTGPQPARPAANAGDQAAPPVPVAAQPTGTLFEQISAILKGIDEDEADSDSGWWETNAGAEFGAKKLEEIRAMLAAAPSAPSVSVDRPAANAGGLVTGTGQPAIGPTWARNADGGLHFVGAPTATSAASQDVPEGACEAKYSHNRKSVTVIFRAHEQAAAFQDRFFKAWNSDRLAATSAGCEAAGLHKPKQT